MCSATRTLPITALLPSPTKHQRPPCARAGAPPRRSSRCRSSSAAAACAAARWVGSWRGAAWRPPAAPCWVGGRRWRGEGRPTPHSRRSALPAAAELQPESWLPQGAPLACRTEQGRRRQGVVGGHWCRWRAANPTRAQQRLGALQCAAPPPNAAGLLPAAIAARPAAAARRPGGSGAPTMPGRPAYAPAARSSDAASPSEHAAAPPEPGQRPTWRVDRANPQPPPVLVVRCYCLFVLHRGRVGPTSRCCCPAALGHERRAVFQPDAAGRF